MRRVHDTQRRPGAPDIRRIRLDVRSRDDIPAIPIGLQDPCGDEGTRKRLFRLPGRQAGDGTVDRPGAGGREAGSRVRFRPASGTGEPAHPDPAKAGDRATDHGTGTDTGVRLIACRSSRRSFPPRSEGRSWRGATGWPEKSLAPRCAAAVIPSWPGPTSTIRRTAACRWTRRGAWSGDVSRACGGAGAARLAAEGTSLRKAPERLPPGGHVTARQPAPEGRGGAPLRLALKLADRRRPAARRSTVCWVSRARRTVSGASSAMSGTGRT